ncbi:MAG: MobF family relaxase [Acidimicrobiales bacterium]
MLRVTRLTDRSGRYYLDDLASELGPARAAGGRREGGPGLWTGAGSAGLGLSGPVERADLEAVLAGRRPGDGRHLVTRRGGVAGVDLTFTAPKSVSVLFALSPPEVSAEVLAAHERAVEAAMGYVTRRAATVRRGSGDERRPQPVDGLVAAGFAHGLSRADDPHLHTHVVVANLGHGADGRWTALDGRGLRAHAQAAGALYGADLRHRLSDALGVEWTATARGTYELTGIDPAVVGAFSTRGSEIRAELAATGRHSAAAARVAWARTRDPKGESAGAPFTGRWRAQAAAVGWTAAELPAALHRGAPAPGRLDEHRFAAGLGDPVHGAVTRRQALTAWAGALRGGTPAVDAERCADRLATWGDGVGVAEERRPPSDVVPAAHLLSALGPRPGSPRLLETWHDGADAVARYRARWGVTDRSRPLGTEGSGAVLAAMGTQRLADHLATTRRLEAARRELGREGGRWAGPPDLGLGLG